MTTETLLLHPAVLCLGTFLGIMMALEIGHQLALRHKTSAKEISGGAVDAAIFALLGLLIAFTFSGAAQRLDHRRDLIVDEANAIGTAWLRIDTLPAAAQGPLRADFRTYIDSRKAAYAVVNDRALYPARPLRPPPTRSWPITLMIPRPTPFRPKKPPGCAVSCLNKASGTASAAPCASGA